MSHLILQGDNTMWPGFSLLGESSLAITFDETGLAHQNQLPFLVLSGTTSVSIASNAAINGVNLLFQLAEQTNDLTTVTIKGSGVFFLGQPIGHSNSGDGVVTDIAATAAAPTTIASSLKLIDASATTGQLVIDAGATNTHGAGTFLRTCAVRRETLGHQIGFSAIRGSGEQDTCTPIMAGHLR
jgi:hypothetical protein